MDGCNEEEGEKTKKKKKIEPMTLTWEEKNEAARKEENDLKKQIQDLKTWTDEIAGMDDEQVLEYLKNRPPELKTQKIHDSKHKEKVQRVSKSKPPRYTGVVASVMKFHRGDDARE